MSSSPYALSVGSDDNTDVVTENRPQSESNSSDFVSYCQHDGNVEMRTHKKAAVASSQEEISVHDQNVRRQQQQRFETEMRRYHSYFSDAMYIPNYQNPHDGIDGTCTTTTTALTPAANSTTTTKRKSRSDGVVNSNKQYPHPYLNPGKKRRDHPVVEGQFDDAEEDVEQDVVPDSNVGQSQNSHPAGVDVDVSDAGTPSSDNHSHHHHHHQLHHQVKADTVRMYQSNSVVVAAAANTSATAGTITSGH
jgi:hypothetical protein